MDFISQTDFYLMISYFLIFILEFLESYIYIGLFIPGTIILILAGYFAGTGYFNILYLLTLTTFASFISSLLAYQWGLKKGYPLKNNVYFIRRIKRCEKFYRKYKDNSIFLARFLGQTRPIISLVAGKNKYDKSTFIIYSLFSALIWNSFFIFLGYFFAASIGLADFFPDQFGIIISFAVIILALFYFRRKLVKRLNRFID